MRIYYEVLALRKANEYDSMGMPVKLLIECEDYPDHELGSFSGGAQQVIAVKEM